MLSAQRYDTQPNRAAPLLEYAVSSGFVSTDEIHVMPYSTPHALFSCTSPLASLITHYNRLLQVRQNTESAEMWNVCPNIIFEEQEKTFINDAVENAAVLQITKEMHENSAVDAYKV